MFTVLICSILLFRRIFLPSTPWILRIVEKPIEWNPPGFEKSSKPKPAFLLVGGFNPSEKDDCQIGSFPKVGMKINP